MKQGCKTCKRSYKSKKMQPYGVQPGKFWCETCDCGKVSTVNKTKERRNVKKQIERDRTEE